MAQVGLQYASWFTLFGLVSRWLPQCLVHHTHIAARKENSSIPTFQAKGLRFLLIRTREPVFTPEPMTVAGGME